MLRNASPRLLLHLFIALVAALWWGSVAVGAATGDTELSAGGLLAGLAFVVLGCAGGGVHLGLAFLMTAEHQRSPSSPIPGRQG